MAGRSPLSPCPAWARAGRAVAVAEGSVPQRCRHGASSGPAPEPGSRCRCPRAASASQPCPLSLAAQSLGLAGAPSPQLLVEPPWRPAVLWDRVTLTCRGSGTAGDTTWYKDGRLWWQERPQNFTVNQSGTYECDRAGNGLSPSVTVSDGWPVLQVTAGPLLEGDTVTLRCRSRQGILITGLRFYHGEKDLGKSLWGSELSLSPLRLQHSGQYRCGAWENWWSSRMWLQSEPVSVTVHELFPVPVLEAPAELLAGSPLNLSCLSSRSPLRPLTPLVHRFYRDGRELGGPQGSPQLLLPALGLSGSGNYSCEVQSQGGAVRKSSAPLRVTVLAVLPSVVSVWSQPPGAQVALGDPLVLNCAVAAGTGPLSFSWHREGSGTPLGTGPRLQLPSVGDNDSGHYRCRVSDGDSVAESGPLNVTVLVPVANATISPGALGQQVRAGEPVRLRCSVQVGSAPVTFTWLRHGREVARGPLLELAHVGLAHSGTYQCVATNQLGQDGHRVFRALSPELLLEVTAGGHGHTVAAAVGGSLLFLLLLLAVAAGWRRWNNVAARKQQERAPPAPPEEEEEVLYSRVVSSQRPGGDTGLGHRDTSPIAAAPTQSPRPGALAGSPRAPTLQDPRVIYAELRRPHGRPRERGDIDGDVL
ncbi:Fc receptor-like protein 2 isoform X2 [Poecile atricapillus]|uniref:Fc receptor-like protein 2 isoform X2 n=1 Tax=Poecile atricapillus TaxID=48891 RepID=UPI002738EF4B|nr:Fc receptor-like protein 2 isoform X2 [Poecile atricapillus]